LDKKTGELVAAHNPNLSLIPASSLKLLTCSYGLEVLKGDFRFKTQLEITGNVDANGILKGDLILHGFGDPTLGSEMTEGSSTIDQVLNSLVDAVIKAGIRSIDGYIYGDGSYFSNEGIYDSWLWNDIGNYYAAGIYGLNIYDNLYKLKFKQSMQGSSPDIATVYPNVPGLKFASEVLSAGPKSGDNAFIYGMQFNCKVRGSIPSGKGTFEIKGSMPDPPKVATWLLYEKLKEMKISSKGMKSSLSDPLPDGKRTVLKTHYSLPLENIVQQTLLKSINLNAEAILRYCGAKSLPNATIESAIKGFEAFLQQESDNATGFFLADGSGLSTLNSIQVMVLQNIKKNFQEKSISSILEASLPIAGISGTMKNYLINSPLKVKYVQKPDQ
jgi:D-alanyl-D-alanine carboxypeptidase/D-alanyl-D-alanine-endopeptidase (penicillin-binding protein 4)